MSVYVLTNSPITIDAPFGPSYTGLAGTVSVQILDSSGNVIVARTTSGITESPAGTGDYVTTISGGLSSLGSYRAAWSTGGGSPQWAFEDIFVVAELPGGGLTTPSGSDLCVLDDVRTMLEYQTSFTARDDLIADFITMASTAIIHEFEREFAPISTGLTRRFRVDAYTRRAKFGPYDLQSADTVTLNPESDSPITLTAETDYLLGPTTPWTGTYKYLKLQPFANVWSQHFYLYGHAYVDVTGTWGFASVPDDVRIACQRTVQSWMNASAAAEGLGDLDSPARSLVATPDTGYGLSVATLNLAKKYKELLV